RPAACMAATALLFVLVGLLSSIRAPTRADASAAFWQSARITINRPRSMARAVNANSPTRARATTGMRVPRRRGVRVVMWVPRSRVGGFGSGRRAGSTPLAAHEGHDVQLQRVGHGQEIRQQRVVVPLDPD